MTISYSRAVELTGSENGEDTKSFLPASTMSNDGDGMDSYDENGAEICICTAHRLEYCLKCAYDFRDMNDTERKRARMHRIAGCWAAECENSGTQQCSACMIARYCSPACQKTHWKAEHKKKCKKMKAPPPTNTAATVATTVAAGSGRKTDATTTIRDSQGKSLRLHCIGTRCRKSAAQLLECNAGRKIPLTQAAVTLTILEYNPRGGFSEDNFDNLPEYIVTFDDSQNERHGIICEDLHQDYAEILSDDM